MDPDDSTAETAGGARQTWRRWRERARERWHQHGKPLVEATRVAVREAAATPRGELEKERYVRIGEMHLKRLLADQIAKSPKIIGGELDLREGVVHLQVDVRRWRTVHGDIRFRLVIGHENDHMIEVGILRTGSSRLSSDHWLMNLLIRLWVAWAHWHGDTDPFDHFLLGRNGARRDGNVIYVPIEREPLTRRVGKSRVLRRIAAYATVSSLKIEPGELVVGYHLGRLANRMSDMRVLRHLLRESSRSV